jgi:ryanodine receptor 2
MNYTPKPIDTCGIALPQDILELTEQLAEHAHDVWAQRRIREGWTYGKARDDKTKKHPDLVPYNDLPDSEKEYDRSAAMETLKAIVALGYRLEKT